MGDKSKEKISNKTDETESKNVAEVVNDTDSETASTFNAADKIREYAEEISKESYVKSSDIPRIGLYMDQVTTFLDEQLGFLKRHDNDKVLTKTMINNYAKSELIPPPVKKKYNVEQMLLLIYIFYFKNIMSINDIKKLLDPIISRRGNIETSELFDKVYIAGEKGKAEFTNEMERILELAETTMSDIDFKAAEDGIDNNKSQQYYEMFAFITMLGQDICNKLRMIEKLLDSMDN